MRQQLKMFDPSIIIAHMVVGHMCTEFGTCRSSSLALQLFKGDNSVGGASEAICNVHVWKPFHMEKTWSEALCFPVVPPILVSVIS